MSNTSKRMTYILGIGLSFIMVASLMLPLLSSLGGAQQTPPPEPTPAPTLPPPPDVSEITFDETYLHPSGLFTVAIPSGWLIGIENNSTTEARVTMNNAAIQSVIDVRVMAIPDVETVEDLDAYFNASWLQASWTSYDSRGDLEARRVIEGDQLIIDFNLSRLNQNYIARQIAETDGNWVYLTRVVTLDNASEELQHVLNNVAQSIQPNTEFLGTPFSWNGYFDAQDRHLIRYPSSWEVTDTADGAPTTVEGPSLVTAETEGESSSLVEAILNVQSQDGSISDEAAASDWVASWRSNVEVLTPVAVEQNGLEGYAVSYKITTLDGETESGVALLLNSEEQVHIANLRLKNVDVDLNGEDITRYSEALSILDTFSLFPDLDLTIPEEEETEPEA